MAELVRFLEYDDNEDNYKWLGSFEDLKVFINFALEITDDADHGGTTEDKMHKAFTYKVNDAYTRFYTTTGNLKLLGPNYKQLQEGFCKLLTPLDHNSSASGNLDASTASNTASNAHILSPATEDVTVSAANSSIRCEVNQIRAELNDLKRHVYSANMQYPIPSGTSAKENMQISSLQDEIRTLLDANQHLTAKVEAANQKAAELENERNSLLTALRLLQTEYTESTASANDNSWTTVSHKNGRNRYQDHTMRTNNGQDSVHASQKNNDTTPDAEKKKQNSKAKSSSVIIGDSIVSRLNGWKMSNQNNRVTVRSFSGATVEEIEEHYIRPTLKSSPDSIILHVGTNNLKTDDPNTVAEKIINLCDTIARESPTTKVAISELTPRTDAKDDVQEKVLKVNKRLRTFGRSRDLHMIPHAAITEKELNASGLHLNAKGTALLAKDIVNFLKANN